MQFRMSRSFRTFIVLVFLIAIASAEAAPPDSRRSILPGHSGVGDNSAARRASSTEETIIRGQSPVSGVRFAPPPLQSTQDPWLAMPASASVASGPVQLGPPTSATQQTTFNQPGMMLAPPGGTYAPPGQYVPQPGIADPFLQNAQPGVPVLYEPPVWMPYISGEFKGGTDLVLGEGQLMLPLFQDGESMLFADIRGKFDDSDNAEGNFGLGYRKMFDQSHIFGIYGFYDYLETENDNEFSQATVGMELLAVLWEARVNGYIPQSDAKSAPGQNQAFLDQNLGGVFVRSGLEAAYWGIDGEVGALLHEWCCGQSELRGYIGGFYFDNDEQGFEQIAGPRGRLEFRQYDLAMFGPGSRLTLGVEVQWDEVRDTQVFGMARLQIPLGSGGVRPYSRLERRMLNPIVRDVDIVTNTALGPKEYAYDQLTNRRLDNVQLTNVAENPDLDAVLAAAPAMNGPGGYSMVIADGSKGEYDADVAADDTIDVQPDQQLLGGGSRIRVYGENSGAVATFRAPGTAPTINGVAGKDTIRLDHRSALRGVNVVGGRNGVIGDSNANGVADDLVRIAVVNNTVQGATADGFQFANLDNATILADNSAIDNGDDGFDFIDNAGSVTGNTASGNLDEGFEFQNNSGTISGNTASANDVAADSDGDGFEFVNNFGTFSNNTSIDNGDDGFDFQNNFGVFTDNSASGNGDEGFEFANNFGTFTGNLASGNDAAADSDGDGFQFVSNFGEFRDNMATGNGGDGFDFTDNFGTFTDNVANNNRSDGFQFDDNVGTFSGNSASDNDADGFVFDDNFGNFTDNLASTNGGRGFGFDDNSGTFSQNMASKNVGHGFQFDTNNIGGTIEDNLAKGNGGDGFLFNTNNGLVTGNSATRNTGDGFQFTTNTGPAPLGIFSNNVSRKNGESGFEWTTQNGVATGNKASGNGADNALPPP